MLPHEYQKRFYRAWISAPGLVSFQVQVKETDLHIQAESPLTSETEELVLSYRHQIESYIAKNPDFLTCLVPVPQDILAPAIVREMIEAGWHAGVGPMAAVAGAIAGRVGRELGPDEWEKLFHTPPKPKVVHLFELIQKAKGK